MKAAAGGWVFTLHIGMPCACNQPANSAVWQVQARSHLMDSASAGAHLRYSMPCLPYSMVAICAVTFCALRPISGSPVACKQTRGHPSQYCLALSGKYHSELIHTV